MKRFLLLIPLSLVLMQSCDRKYHLANVTIDTLKYITHTSAIAVCNVTDDGGEFVDVKGVCWSEASPATINDSYSDRGNQGTGKYESPLFNLKPGTTYYVRAYAKNLAGISYSDEIKITTLEPEYLFDSRDNQKYPIVKIGNQYWMAENLNYFTSNGSWYYDNDSIKYSRFGRLYNWYMARDVCPDGWHLADNKDWDELFIYLNDSVKCNNGNYCSAYKLKLPGTTMWEYESDQTNNETGFSAVAAGTYDSNTNSFYNNMVNGVFWSFNESGTDKAWFYRLESYSNCIYSNYGDKNSGLSVRCIKDK